MRFLGHFFGKGIPLPDFFEPTTILYCIQKYRNHNNVAPSLIAVRDIWIFGV